MRGIVKGAYDGVVRYRDGVLHNGVRIEWGRARTTFVVMCDFEAIFPDWEVGSIDLEKMRREGARCSVEAHPGTPTCIACIIAAEGWRNSTKEGVTDDSLGNDW
jgi:hypothetical protein